MNRLRKPDLLPRGDPKPAYRHLELRLASPLPSLPIPSPSGVGVRFDDNRGYQADEEDEGSTPTTQTFEIMEDGKFTMDALPRYVLALS